MASAPSGSLKFFLLFDVQDISNRQLATIAIEVQNIQKATESATKAAEVHQNKALEAFEQMREVGSRLREFGMMSTESLMAVAEGIVENASRFESIGARIRFAYGAEANAAYRRIQEFSLVSVYSLSEIATAAASLRTAFKESDLSLTDSANRVRARNGQMITILEAFSDAAAGSEQRLGDVLGQVERAMEGQYQSLTQQLRLSVTEVNNLKKAVRAAHTDQEKLLAVAAAMAAHYGGAQAAMANTFEFAKNQLPDILEQLQAAIGREGLPLLTEFLNELSAALREIMNDREFIAILSDGFKLLAQSAVHVGKFFISALFAVRDFIKAHPGVVRLAVTLVTIVNVLATLVGTILVIIGSVGAATAAFNILGLSVGALSMIIGKGLLLFAGLIVVLRSAWSVIVAAWESDFAGIRSFFNGASAVVTAFYEAFSNWGRDSVDISEETANALNNAGLLDWFMNAVAWVARLQRFFEGVWNSLKDGWNTVRPDVVGAIDALDIAFRSIGDAIYKVVVALGLTQPAATTSFSQATGKGREFGQFLNSFVIPAIRLVADALRFVAWIASEVVAPTIRFIAVVVGEVRHFVVTHFGFIGTVLKVIAMIILVQVYTKFLAIKAAALIVVEAVKTYVVPVFTSFYHVLQNIWHIAGRLTDRLRSMVPDRVISSLGWLAQRGGSLLGINQLTQTTPTQTTVHDQRVSSFDSQSRGERSSTQVGRSSRTVDEADVFNMPRGVESERRYRTQSSLDAGAASSVTDNSINFQVLSNVMHQQLTATREQNNLIRSGALRPQIGGEALSGVVHGADTDISARSGIYELWGD